MLSLWRQALASEYGCRSGPGQFVQLRVLRDELFRRLDRFVGQQRRELRRIDHGFALKWLFVTTYVLRVRSDIVRTRSAQGSSCPIVYR